MRKPILLLCLFACATPRPLLAATINVPTDFPTIGAAVRAAAPGDTVSVGAGSYEESVRIENRPGLVLIADGAVTIEPDDDRDGVVVRASDGTTISGFEIVGGRYGVLVGGSSRVSIMGNSIEESCAGIRIDGGDRNSVTDNEISDLTGITDEFGRTYGGHAIRIQESSDAMVDGNAIGDPAGEGIVGSRAPGLVVRNNTVAGCGRHGIRLKKSPYANVVDNDSSGNRKSGLRIEKSESSAVDQNVCSNNERLGIRVRGSAATAVSGNTADRNARYGIRVKKSPPLASEADLRRAGNAAAGNGVADLRVDDRVR